MLVRLDAKNIDTEWYNSVDFLITASMAEKAGADAIDVSAYGNTSKGIAFTEAPLVHEPGVFGFRQNGKKRINYSENSSQVELSLMWQKKVEE